LKCELSYYPKNWPYALKQSAKGIERRGQREKKSIEVDESKKKKKGLDVSIQHISGKYHRKNKGGFH